MVRSVVGSSWLVVCVCSYYYYNQAYYTEKLSVFFSFFSRLI